MNDQIADAGESVPAHVSDDPGDTLVFENDRVRVWSMTLSPHGVYDYHQHHFDHLVLWPEAGRAEAQQLGDDGWPLRQTADAGYVAFKTVGSSSPLTPHRIRNLEDHSVTHYIVEFIDGPSPSPTDRPVITNDRGSAVDTRTGRSY